MNHSELVSFWWRCDNAAKIKTDEFKLEVMQLFKKQQTEITAINNY